MKPYNLIDRIEGIKESLGYSPYTLTFEDVVDKMVSLHIKAPLTNNKQMYIFESRSQSKSYLKDAVKTHPYSYLYMCRSHQYVSEYVSGFKPNREVTYIGHSIYSSPCYPSPPEKGKEALFFIWLHPKNIKEPLERTAIYKTIELKIELKNFLAHTQGYNAHYGHKYRLIEVLDV